MSFWEQEAWTPQHRGSIDNILKSDEPTLVKLLDDDELVAEVSNLHDGLLLFLSRQDILQELLGWMLGDDFDEKVVEQQLDKGPDFQRSDGPDMDEIVDFTEFEPPLSQKMLYKFPHSAYQVLQCGVGMLLDLILKDSLPQFFVFLKSRRLQERTYSFYWFQTFKVICQRNGSQVFDFLQQDTEYVEILISNLDNQTISDLLLYISCEDTMDILTNELLVFRNWLYRENNFTRKIIGRLEESNSRSMQNAVSKFILDFFDQCSANSIQSDFITDLNSREIAEQLVDFCLQPGRSNLPALSVVIKLLQHDSAVVIDEDDSEAITPEFSYDKSALIEAVRNKLPQFQQLLTQAPNANVQLPAYSLTPPLSRNRLKIVQLCLGMVGNPLTDAHYDDLKNSGIIPTCVQLFFDFPLNNLLHAAVAKIIRFFLESFSHTCYAILFEDVNLLKLILDAWNANK